MQKIYKYPIQNVNAEYAVKVPEGAKAISVGSPDGNLNIYYVFDPENEYTHVMRRVLAVYTGVGFRIPEGSNFIGTCIIGPLVYHVYELPQA